MIGFSRIPFYPHLPDTFATNDPEKCPWVVSDDKISHLISLSCRPSRVLRAPTSSIAVQWQMARGCAVRARTQWITANAVSYYCNHIVKVDAGNGQYLSFTSTTMSILGSYLSTHLLALIVSTAYYVFAPLRYQ